MSYSERKLQTFPDFFFPDAGFSYNISLHCCCRVWE